MYNVVSRRDSKNEERDVRVEDYLNDKLQTQADLESIDSLLKNVRKQQTLLQLQLREAERALVEVNDASKARSTELSREVDRFKQRQFTIDRRLLIVTQSETSDDAVIKFHSSMEKLRRLDIAKGYAELLTEVEKLSWEARRNFQSSPQAVLQPYLRLQRLSIALQKAQPTAEDAAPHLIDHVERTVNILWQQMKTSFATEFEETLSKIKWPEKCIIFHSSQEKEWNNGVERLLELQEPELKAQETNDDTSEPKDALVLLPLEVLIKPLELRFGFHFYGDRPTNRVDKPEYFLSHIFGLLNTYEEFFTVHLQPILSRYFKGSNLALNTCYIDSTSALITAILPMLRNKVFALLPQLSMQPQLLSHLMHELMSFDSSLKEDWGYDGGYGVNGWKGLTWEVLVKRSWFDKWLKIEKDFALARYQSIVDAPDHGEIDYDSMDPGTTKPTKGVIRVNDLLETVTDRYRPLTSFSQKLRFLIDIQIAIFDKLHELLYSSLEAYLTRTSAIARTVQGVSKEDQALLHGLGGLERLCRVYGSAEYLEKKMRDWSDDVFFLELWDELQRRARNQSLASKSLAGNMSVGDVAERTSSVVGSDEDSGALFDETASAYRRLRVRTEGVMQDMLINNVRESFRAYSRINPWSSLSSDSANLSSISISAELDDTVQQLSSFFSFLSKVLAEAPLKRICRQIALAIQTFLWDNVLMRYSFSSYGIAQLSTDLSAVWQVFDKHLGAKQGEIGMRKLYEALVLIGLPVVSEPESTEDVGVVEGSLGIWVVEQRVFRSNESAREVLEELRLETLTAVEARQVLERRVELGS